MQHRIDARAWITELELKRDKHILPRVEERPSTQSHFGDHLILMLLIVNAFFLAWLAGKAWRGIPIREALRRLCRNPFVMPTNASPPDIRLAATRASRYIGRFGGLDSCVTRSLVIARLLRDRGDVCLRLGFMPVDESGKAVAGHAWVCLDGVNISDPAPESISSQFLETNRLDLIDYR